MSGPATIFGSTGLVTGTTAGGQPQVILSDGQALRSSMAVKKTTAGDTLLTVLSQLLAGNNGDLILPVGPMAWNGTLFEPLDNNREILVMAPVSRTVNTYSAVQTNKNARGLIIALRSLVVPGVDTIQLYFGFQAFNSLLNYHVALGPAVATTGQFTYYVANGATVSGGLFDAALQAPVPRNWYVLVLHSGAGAFTYEVDAIQVL